MMTKVELIKRYGIEWYEQYLAKRRASWKFRYHNDSEYRESHKTRNKTRYNDDSQYRESCRASNKVRYKERYKDDSAYRESKKARSKERYHNDSDYKESMKAYYKTRYVKDGKLDLIENYELAKADNFNNWDIHHRLELHPDYSVRFTRQSLIKLNLYYNRPPSELIWLKHSEHMRMHGKSSPNETFRDLLERAAIEHKAVLEYLKDK